ncbi:hypothetical protein ACLMJK_001480 [Lecanora helva]
MTEYLNEPDASQISVELSKKYIDRIFKAYDALVTLVPFDNSAKIKEAAPYWRALYDVLAFTSVDNITESLILNDDRIISKRDSLRHVFGECEIALEEHWATEIESTATIGEGT